MLIYLRIVYPAFSQQSWVAATENIWPTKPKILTIWPWKENVCWTLSQDMVFAFRFKMATQAQPSQLYFGQLEWRKVKEGPSFSLYGHILGIAYK